MPKTNAERVRDAEQKRRDRGEREIRIWVPDRPAAIQAAREFAATLRNEATR